MVGTTVSHYRIFEHLGSGGMGVVYRALDTRLDREVALKFLPATLKTSPDELARFKQEARAISAQNHPHIATLYDIGEHEGQPFLVLEYLAGGTLKARLNQLKAEDRDLPLAEAVDYGLQIAEALADAHEHGVVHRDVKTDNLLLTAKGQAKLTDFGLARLRGKLHLTATGSTLGTAAYMSPEQVRAEELDARSDLFSFGVVLYELATTRLPFRGDYEAALSFAILNETPPALTSLRHDAPLALERIVDRCLEKDKAKRYQDAGEVAADLQKLKLARLGSATPAGAAPAPTPRRRWLPFAVGAAVLLAAAAGAWLLLRPSRPTGANARTVAVLPFENLSGDKEEEYFSDGITDDIITQLTQIGGLKVISRTSAMRYKGTAKGMRQIARELNAGVILEGSVRRAGSQVRIVARLIDPQRDENVWAQTYDRDGGQVLTVQSDIARSIASALRTQLTPGEARRLDTAGSVNTDVYNLVLQGRFFIERRDSASVIRGVELLRRAVAMDSTDARAWAALARAYARTAPLGQDEIGAFARSRTAAERAIRLDDRNAEAHATLGFVLNSQWDFQGAERELGKALDLEPGNAYTISRVALLAATRGRFDEAIALGRRSTELDPISSSNQFNLSNFCWYAGRLPEAMAAARKAIELAPQMPMPHFMGAMVQLGMGNVDSAWTMVQGEPGDVWRTHGQAIIHFAAGRRTEADAALAALVSEYPVFAAFQIAEAYAYRGEADRAFEWLEKAYRQRDGGLVQIIGDPLLANIVKDPRYAALLRRLKLAD
jgi:TolB-like protein/Flp pilus assembly protein TadD